MVMVLFMGQKLTSNCLMYLEDNINVVLCNLISSYLKDLIYNLEVASSNMLKRDINTKNVSKRKMKMKKKEERKKVKRLK